MTADFPLVAVGVCTYKRPTQLERLLRSLGKLEFPAAKLVVVVIDHDPERSAAPVVERLAHEFRSIRYAVEPVRLISAARNRLVAEAIESGARFVAFVDDDEWVPEKWLRMLVERAIDWRADAVAGPVLPVYEAGIASWIVDGAFFMRKRFATGEIVAGHGIGNVLVDTEFLRTLDDAPFGHSFRMPGGEDTYFLRRFADRGGRLFWCDEAVLFEWIPQTRANPRWLVRRAFLGGETFSQCLRCEGASAPRISVRALKCLTRIVQGIAELSVAAFGGRTSLAAAVCRIAGGVGGLRGLVVLDSGT